MKFYCDACNTKYAISDEKVRGKVLKIRCKNCGNIITVREAVAPLAVAATDPTISVPQHIPDLAAQVPTTNWYYALNGQTFGPFTLEGLRRKYSVAEIGDATYVWHERLGSWKPVATEPLFADALALGYKIVPSRKTLGFTGPVEAIRVVHGGPSQQREGAVPNAAHARSHGDMPRAQQRSTSPPQRSAPPPRAEKPRPHLAPTPEARPIKDARQAKLDRLRATLGTSLGPAAEDAPPFDALPKPVGGEAIFTFADGITPASAESSQDLMSARATESDAIDFNLPPRSKPSKPSPSSTSDILDRVIGPTLEPPPSEASEVDDSGVIPFFPEAPHLPSGLIGKTGKEATSESLLIDVHLMNRRARKRNVLAAVIVGVVLTAVFAVGATLAVLNKENTAEAEEPARVEQKDELTIRRYDKDEVGKIATMDLEEELLFTEEEADWDEPLEGELPAMADADPKPKAVRRTATPHKTPHVEEPPPDTQVAPTKPVDPIAQILAPRASREPAVNAPVDKLRQPLREGLTKDQARQGFQLVRRSIRDCRERHNRYNARLSAGKLKVSVTVQPRGFVSAFTLNPPSVRNTEFSRCMESHQGRWRFAQFTGKAVEIKQSVIIQ